MLFTLIILPRLYIVRAWELLRLTIKLCIPSFFHLLTYVRTYLLSYLHTYNVLQVKELFHFCSLCGVFLFAYGIAAQSLLYPNSGFSNTLFLYNVFYYPYRSGLPEFPLGELQGKQ